MPSLTATWHPITHLPILPRHSHAISILQSSLHLFSGGGTTHPIGSELHIFPLNPAIPISITILASPVGPPPRDSAASATLGETLYVFGGCGGEMELLEECGRLWTFEVGMHAWKPLDPADEAAPFPQARKRHSATAAGGKVYIHAGCAETGMLGDLWSFDVAATRWDKLKDAPGEPRDGASIAVTGGREIWRFGGVDSFGELGGVVDVYDIPTDTWRTIKYSLENGPTTRNISCLIPITHAQTRKEYLITIFGDTSSLNMDPSAGKLLHDVWAYDISAAEWCEVTFPGEETNKPMPRGYFAAALAGSTDTMQGIVIQGGRDHEQKTLGDWWILIFD